MSDPAPRTERRSHRRIRKAVPVKVKADDFDLVTETRNLSQAGAYFESGAYIEPMTRLRIQLLLPFKKNDRVVTKKIACRGVVVRTESVPGEERFHLAVFFNDIDRKDAECLSEYVASVLSREGDAAA